MQIVHDLKNQLNGLKLYATFLRRRIEKSERPGDEQETVGKLINGLNRAAEDLSLIVRYGQPLELKKQAGVDVNKVLQSACASPQETGGEVVLEPNPEAIQGSFDPFKLGEVTVSAKPANAGKVLIEWSGLRQLDHDPFRAFAGSEEIKLALAARIIEAHGGTVNVIDRKFAVELPLSD
jgi:signal transduction histidine kinase